ncbi:hypothetical protein V6N13_054740 [Hibiscus sabdariffa]
MVLDRSFVDLDIHIPLAFGSFGFCSPFFPVVIGRDLEGKTMLGANVAPSRCSAYRALYILNWIYRYFAEEHFVHWITWISGFVQTLLYADFFYYYFQSWKNNVKLQLPA